MQTGPLAHRNTAKEIKQVNFAIITVSDTRTIASDVNGQFLKNKIAELGHTVVDYVIVKDEPEMVEAALDSQKCKNAQIVLLNGGTGISARDRTFDVLERKLEKVLTGFGEIFRMLSYDQVGAAAMLSRAAAGVYDNRMIISTPGSPAAVELAWDKLIAPEIRHLAWELTR